MAVNHIAKTAIIVYVLLLVLGGECYGQSMVYRWGDLHWNNRTVRQVGDTTLPVGLTLPSWFTPIGDKALLLIPSSIGHSFPERGSPQCVVYFWFALEKRQRIIEWLNAFPADFILPAGSFSIIDPYVEAHTVSPADPRNWQKVDQPKAKKWKYWLTLCVPAEAPLQEFINVRASDLQLPSLYDDDLHGMSPGFAPAVLSPVSPIRKEKSLVLVSFRFDKPT